MRSLRTICTVSVALLATFVLLSVLYVHAYHRLSAVLFLFWARFAWEFVRALRESRSP